MGRSRPKRPTRDQKIRIKRAGQDPAGWLVLWENTGALRIVSRSNGTSMDIEK